MSSLTGRRSRRVRVGVLMALAVAMALAVVWLRREEPYVQFRSPDGRFTLIVYRRPRLFGMSPGQAGDVPGRAVLVDQHGKVLQEAPVEMVQLVEVREWRSRAVEVRPFNEDWPLPE